MPLSRDEKGGGAEKDGSLSKEYCSHCYQNGQFTEPDLTVEQMVEKVSVMMKGMHMPGFVISNFTKGIPKLKRWI